MGLFNNRAEQESLQYFEYEDSDIYYYPSPFERFIDWIREHLVFTWIFVASLVVVIGVIVVILLARSNNPVSNFISGSSKLVDSGGFDFKVGVIYDGDEYMTYNGAIKFNEAKQEIKASYTGTYTQYSYTNVTYTCRDKVTYLGNYYNEKWTITEDNHLVTDFYDFFRDYKNNRFDGNAYISFFGKTGELVPTELNKTVERVLGKFISGTTSILHGEVIKDGSDTVYIFTPELDKVFDVVLNNNKSVFSSADTYVKYSEILEMNKENLKDARLVIKYVLDKDGCLTELHWDLNDKGKVYQINAEFTNIGNPHLNIPKDFYKECGIDLNEVMD